MSPDFLIALTSAHSVGTGFSVPGTSRPEWTFAEAAQACKDLPDHQFAAMLYSYAGATEMYFRLHAELRKRVLAEARRKKWCTRVKRGSDKKRPFISDLCAMCLVQEARPSMFRVTLDCKNPFAREMQIYDHTWSRRISHIYAFITAEYAYWLSDARSQMNRWLQVDEVA